MTTCENYWRKTGAKFSGSSQELEKKLSDCGKQHAWTDEEGYFDSFLCTVDFEKCDKCCSKHNPKLDEDWMPFVDAINKSLEG